MLSYSKKSHSCQTPGSGTGSVSSCHLHGQFGVRRDILVHNSILTLLILVVKRSIEDYRSILNSALSLAGRPIAGFACDDHDGRTTQRLRMHLSAVVEYSAARVQLRVSSHVMNQISNIFSEVGSILEMSPIDARSS